LASAQSAGGSEKVNPFTGNPEAIKEGRALYLQHNCSGCHGVGGGGGMATPLIDGSWKFGSSDEALFKLIKGEIPESTMPRTWNSLEPDAVWKIIAYIRSLSKNGPDTPGQ
jgi:mono/diheme cytochrome c family protein